jgi:hypothetical protein
MGIFLRERYIVKINADLQGQPSPNRKSLLTLLSSLVWKCAMSHDAQVPDCS